MLHEFLTDNRDKIIARTRAMVASRPAPRATEVELKYGIPLFLTQLAGMLQTPLQPWRTAIGTSAARHGDELLQRGYTVGQVVHDYGGLCQAITEIAVEDQVPISTSEFKTLNACLDDAIAGAVSEFVRQSQQSASDEGLKQLGFLAHEMRNALNAATLAFEVIKRGTVGAAGSTSTMLARNLERMREIIDRSLVEVRLASGADNRTPLSVKALLDELIVPAELEAQKRGLQFSVESVAVGVMINADGHLLVSALTNLLQNAFKFTKPHSHVALRTVVTAEHVRIEIEDACGGLPSGKIEDLFNLFEQRGEDRSGLGLGLAISRTAVEATGATLNVQDLPGKGCIFAVVVPRAL